MFQINFVFAATRSSSIRIRCDLFVLFKFFVVGLIEYAVFMTRILLVLVYVCGCRDDCIHVVISCASEPRHGPFKAKKVSTVVNDTAWGVGHVI